MNYCQKYYWIRFVYVLSVSFTKTSFIPYLLWRGLSSYEVHLVYAIFNICVMLFEIPVSALGEWIGPKRSFLIGCLCKCVSAIAFFAGTEIYHFYCGEIVSALSIAFISGSLNAWLMDRFNEQEEDIAQAQTSAVFMIGDRLSKIALAVGGASGAYLAYWNLGYPWIFVGIGFVITFYLASFLLHGEDYRLSWKKDKVYPRWQWDNILHGYRITVHNRVLLVLIFNGFLVSFAQASPKMFWLPYLKDYFDKDMFFLGNMWLCLAGIQFLGTFGMAYMLRLAGSALRLKLLFSVFSGLAFFGVILFQQWILGFILLYFFFEWSKPYHEALDLTLTHGETRRKGRITFLSLENLVSKLGTIMGLIGIGWISELYGMFLGWTVALLIYSLIIPCYFYLVWEEKRCSVPMIADQNP